jgi:hypothetical protein
MMVRPPDESRNWVGLCGGIIVVQWRAAEPTEMDAREVMQNVADLAADDEYPLLFTVQGVRSLSAGVQKTLASGSWPAASVAIVASSPVDWVAASFYLSRHTPACTARLFTSVPEAMNWLGQQPAVDKPLKTDNAVPDLQHKGSST